MPCAICETDRNVEWFKCRVCGKTIGKFCSECWLGKEVFKLYESNCRNGKPHRGEIENKGGSAT